MKEWLLSAKNCISYQIDWAFDYLYNVIIIIIAVILLIRCRMAIIFGCYCCLFFQRSDRQLEAIRVLLLVQAKSVDHSKIQLEVLNKGEEGKSASPCSLSIH